MDAADRPLAGRRVLITRPAGRSRGLALALAGLGAEAECRPTIAFEPAGDRAAIDRALRDLGRYDWLVLTSPTGVRFFFDERQRLGGRAAMARAIAVVGPGTARELQARGHEPNRVAADSRGEGLADELAEAVTPGQRVLWVRPETARPVLTERLEALGAVVDAVAFYRTVAAPDLAPLRDAIAAGRFHAAVFTSPSTFRMLAGAPAASAGPVADGLRRLRRVAIGGVTAEALAAAGWPAHAVADSPTDEGIVEALRRAFDA